jgi:hypothetical protein
MSSKDTKGGGSVMSGKRKHKRCEILVRLPKLSPVGTVCSMEKMLFQFKMSTEVITGQAEE